ncbi:hypothetical protein BKP54_02565 [Ensifer sp. 1H6]|nr:hypothetical protein BKP54_02565 [Ensifer sp. 1H6]
MWRFFFVAGDRLPKTRAHSAGHRARRLRRRAAYCYLQRYVDQATNDELVGWYDHGSDLTLASGESLTLDFDGTNGVLTLA